MLRYRLIALAALLLTVPAVLAADPNLTRRRTPVVEVFEQARDAVVNVNTTYVVRGRSLAFGSPLDDIFEFGPRRRGSREVHSVGSGAVIHPSGYIVTNAHVISQASDVSVTFADGRTLDAEIVAADPDHDLAVLKVEHDGPLPACKLGRSDDLMVGETVVAIGNPMGLQHTVTAGIISAIDRELNFDRRKSYTGLIQTDAPINPGNSGGPLLNVNAELIGINTAIRGDAQNIGFAIPVGSLWELLPQMLDIERRQRVRFGLEVSGGDATVVAIGKDTPASRSEIEAGDRVISVDGDAVANGIDYYVHLLNKQAGDAVALGVARSEDRFQVDLTLEAIPLPDGDALAESLLGVSLHEITPELRQRHQLPRYARLVVAHVERGSPAWEAGIRRGDLILRLERVPVGNLTDVGLVLERIAAGERVLVDGVRLDPFFSWNVAIGTRRN